MTGTAKLDSQSYIGKVGYNWHGSYPVFIADAKFEPNFRHFNMVQDASLSNEDLHNKLFKDSEGLPSNVTSMGQFRGRGWPILVSSAALGITTAYFASRMNKMRTLISNPWIPIRYTIAFAVVGNGLRHVLREMSFKNDFERNQYFAYDEIKARRDEERVRKALEAKKYVEDPLTEYRVKAWQVSRAGV